MSTGFWALLALIGAAIIGTLAGTASGRADARQTRHTDTTTITRTTKPGQRRQARWRRRRQ